MKAVSNQQIAEHLKRLNPWWTSGVIDAETQLFTLSIFTQRTE